MRVRQPAIDHDRLGDLGRRIRNAGGLFHLMTKSAAGVFRTCCRIEALSCLIWINSKENRMLEFFYIVILRAVPFLVGSKVTTTTFHLLGCELIDLTFIC